MRAGDGADLDWAKFTIGLGFAIVGALAGNWALDFGWDDGNWPLAIGMLAAVLAAGLVFLIAAMRFLSSRRRSSSPPSGE